MAFCVTPGTSHSGKISSMHRILLLLILSFSFITSNALAESSSDYYAAAMKAYEAKDYQGFVTNLEKLVHKDDSTSPRVTYDLACGYALNHEPEKAIAALKKLADAGLSFAVDQDSDLASLKDSESFQAVQQQFAHNSTPTNHSREFFRTPEPDFLAEGITHDAEKQRFYLGSIHLSKIIEFDASGKVTDFSSATGPVLGMSIDPARNLLWASTTPFPKAEKDPIPQAKAAILKYDLHTKKLLATLPVTTEGEHALGDAIVNSKGDVFTTDSSAPVLYWIPKGTDKLQTFVTSDQFRSLQGLCFSADQKKLFVADYANGLFVVDAASRDIHHIPAPADSAVQGIDGLYLYKGNLIATQNGVDPKRVLWLKLAADSNRVEEVKVLESGNSAFGEPTLGVIAGNAFYYVANHPTLDDLLKNPKIELKPTIILKLDLP